MPSESSPSLAVWLVEDDRLYRDTMTALLNRSARMHCPQAFASTEALLQMLHDCAPAAGENEEPNGLPDILLLDIHLPGQTGIDALPAIRAASPATAVVMLTVAEDSALIFDAFRSGASGYLLKDAPLEDILEAIRQAAAGGTLMPPAVAEHVLAYFRNPSPPAPEYGLTPRERDVLQLLTEGLSQRGIAECLHVSPHTVNTHVQHLYEKLHVNSGIEAVVKAVRERLV
jgi:DNA-binding NarL/FixJ family response regulator